MPDPDGIICIEPDTPQQEGRNWNSLRQLASKRARISLRLVWEDPVTHRRIYRAVYRRFCYNDYRKVLVSLSIAESPTSIGIIASRYRAQGSQVLSHHVISFRHGRLAVYRRYGRSVVRRGSPYTIDLAAPIHHGGPNGPYADALSKFSLRILRLVRAKARRCGVKLAKGDDLVSVLGNSLWPALQGLTDRGIVFHQGTQNLFPGNNGRVRWLLRHMRCPVDELPKSITGYDSRVVKRLFWQSVCIPPLTNCASFEESCQRIHNVTWQSKWAWGALLRTWLPVDYTQRLLSAGSVAVFDFGHEDIRPLKRLLRQFSRKHVLNTLLAGGTYLVDIITLLKARQNLPFPRDARTIRELHDTLTEELNARHRAAIRARKEREVAALTEPFRHAGAVVALHGRRVLDQSGSTHVILIPENGLDLQRWGADMSNCLGTYVSRVQSRDSLIFGVRRESPLGHVHSCDWAVEVQEGRVVQFRGYRNESPPADLLEVVLGELRSSGVLQAA